MDYKLYESLGFCDENQNFGFDITPANKSEKPDLNVYLLESFMDLMRNMAGAVVMCLVRGIVRKQRTDVSATRHR